MCNNFLYKILFLSASFLRLISRYSIYFAPNPSVFNIIYFQIILWLYAVVINSYCLLQTIVSLSYDEWEELVEAYDLKGKTPCIKPSAVS